MASSVAQKPYENRKNPTKSIGLYEIKIEFMRYWLEFSIQNNSNTVLKKIQQQKSPQFSLIRLFLITCKFSLFEIEIEPILQEGLVFFPIRRVCWRRRRLRRFDWNILQHQF